ncbi:hypothetical protein QAD02_000322 [Eretmocerus hayati]|uniref:Uncharacterized protein n=1 Tax=Eretmocerus hayati TaxID=131215 RepID=A0ACC2NE65_9HYME|nr:hypothetical protein QAD02_000322 [Eretmocerus hayati]
MAGYYDVYDSDEFYPQPRYRGNGGSGHLRRLRRRKEKHDIKEICYNHESKKTFDDVPIRKLMVANISQKTTHKELKMEFCRKFGGIDNYILKKNKPGKKNYAFITFKESETAYRVLQACYANQLLIDGQYLRIVPAASWHQPDYIDIYKDGPQRTDYDFFEHQKGVDVADSPDEGSTCMKNYAVEEESKLESPIHNLNNDCLMHIFSYLPYNQRLSIEKVCIRWKAVVLDSWKSERKIDVSPAKFGKPINAPFLYNVLSRANSHVLHIDLSHCDAIKNASLIAVAKLCPNLQSLNINGLQFTSSGVKALVKNLTNLRCLQIKAGVCDNELAALIGNNRKLKKLEIEYPANGHSDGGGFLSRLPLKSIEEVVLINPPVCLESKFCDTITRVQRVKSIKMRGNAFALQKTILGAVGVCSHSLESFEFSQMRSRFPLIPNRQIIEGRLKPIYQLKNLRSIILSENILISDSFLIQLAANLQKLSEVDISGCKSISNIGVKGIASLPRLEKISVNNLNNITDEVLTDMPNLRVLHCHGCPNIHYAGIISLMTIAENIQEIDVSDCCLISNELINAAVEIAEKRKGKVLKIFVKGTSCGKAESQWKSKFLQNSELPYVISPLASNII